MSLLNFLFRDKSQKVQYELVEYKLDEETFRQGIRLTCDKYRGMIITVDPRVSVKFDEADNMVLSYSFTVEANPNGIEYNKSDLHRLVGDIIVDLMDKDYK